MLTPEAAFPLVVILGMVGLFISGKLPTDLTAFAGLSVLLLAGFIGPEEAFTGFSSPAVINILSIFFVGAALKHTGVADLTATIVHGWVGPREGLLVAFVMLGGGLLSAFMNNIAATAVLMPTVASLARRASLSPSRLYMPLAFGAILGGTTTLIGTAPNLLTTQVMEERGTQGFALFDFAPFGLVLLGLGTLYMLTLGRRLVPTRTIETQGSTAEELARIYRLRERLFSIRIPAGSRLEGMTLRDAAFGEEFDVTVVAVLRGVDEQLAPPPELRLRGNDQLLVEGTLSAVQKLLRRHGLGVEEGMTRLRDTAGSQPAEGEATPGEGEAQPAEAEALPAELESESVQVVEAVIAPRSSIERKTLRELDFRERYGLQVLAIWREGSPIHERLAETRLRVGDALLLQGPSAKIGLLVADPDFLLLEAELQGVRRTDKAPYAVGALALMIALAVSGFYPVQLAAFVAAVIVVVSGAVTMDEVYRAIDWRTIFLIAAMLPLGAAIDRSGAAAAIAGGFVGLVGDLGPAAVLAGLLVLASVLSQAVDASFTVVLLAPVAFVAAAHVGADPRPLMMGVGLGTSVAFVVPFTQKAILLVMGAGGYRIRDFVRVGGLLTLILLVVLWLMIPALLPF